MTLVPPDWYLGGFPDREKVVIDALQPVLDLWEVLDADGHQIYDGVVARRPQAVAWLPGDDRLPYVRVYRGGGATDIGALADPASVQIAALCTTREDSWLLAEFCRQWLLSFDGGGSVHRSDGSTTVIDHVGELNGPQLVPEINPDHRLVPLTFRVVCRRPRGLPDYQKVRESLGH